MGILNFIINLAYSIILLVQPPPCGPGDPGYPNCGPRDGRIPIVEGIYLLLVVGMGLGMKYFKNNKKKM